MKAAGDVDRGGEVDHGGVIAHFPRAKTFAEIAIEIDVVMMSVRFWCEDLVDQSGPVSSACQVPASIALTA